MINIKNFNSDLLKVDKRSYKNIDIYYIGYITIKNISDYESICSANPLYFIIDFIIYFIHLLDGYIEEKNGNKYLIFASTDKNKEVLTIYTKLWDGIKNLIEKINNKSGKYGKEFMKIKFNSEDNLPLNEILKFYNLTVILRSVFQEDSKYYP